MEILLASLCLVTCFATNSSSYTAKQELLAPLLQSKPLPVDQQITLFPVTSKELKLFETTPLLKEVSYLAEF